MRYLRVVGLFVCLLHVTEAFYKSNAHTEQDLNTEAAVTSYEDAPVRSRRQVNPNGVSFSKQVATSIVNQHNRLRTNTTPSAANMQKMIWNEYLAEMAQDWANTCAWQHGQPQRSWTPWPSLGQNLYASSQYSLAAPTDAWFDEWVDYTYNSPNGAYLGLIANCTPNAQCGHYTQVVWHDSYAIGCGVTHCAPISGISFTGYYVVCNYGPAGNFLNNNLYTSGSACASCPSARPSCTSSPTAGLCDWSVPCDGQQCANGGTMDTDACICTCSSSWIGQFCNVTAPTTVGTTIAPTTTTLAGGSGGSGNTTTGNDVTTLLPAVLLMFCGLLASVLG